MHGKEGMTIVEFDISPAEVERAKLGFETIGSVDLSVRVDTSPRLGISYYDKARLTVAGNIALLNSMKDVILPDADVSTAARATVLSGLAALADADKAIAAESDYL